MRLRKLAKWFGIVTATIVIVGVAAFKVYFPSVTIRYRLTLEAQVDGKPKVGSSVVEVTYAKQPSLGLGQNLLVSYRGEAVVLDLGRAGLAFALLRQGNDPRSMPDWIVLRAFGFPYGAFPSPIERGLDEVGRLSGKRELPVASLPLLVRFRDINDPKTIEEVDPLDIAKSFGSGVMLTRATLEIVPAGVWPLNLIGITGEPLTTGIEDKLAWWNGPFLWLKPMGNGVFIDTRTEDVKMNKIEFRRGS